MKNIINKTNNIKINFFTCLLNTNVKIPKKIPAVVIINPLREYVKKDNIQKPKAAKKANSFNRFLNEFRIAKSPYKAIIIDAVAAIARQSEIMLWSMSLPAKVWRIFSPCCNQRVNIVAPHNMAARISVPIHTNLPFSMESVGMNTNPSKNGKTSDTTIYRTVSGEGVRESESNVPNHNIILKKI